MSHAINNLKSALEHAFKNRPSVGGFPYMAEVLRRAGVTRNHWSLPACQSIFSTEHGPVVIQENPLMSGVFDVPKYDEEALIRALRTDQAGKSTFHEFLRAAWQAGVVSYVVDFNKRIVSYYGCSGECYVEAYAHVDLS
jgi:uncharacterized protein YbcV (DUF1398 family)